MTRSRPDSLRNPQSAFRGQVAIERTSSSAGNLRGQVATEFLLYTAVFMLVAIAAALVVNDLQSTEVPLQTNRVAQETGDSFVTALSLAVKGGEGFSYNYSFPKTVFAKGYVMDFQALGAEDPSIGIDYLGDYGAFAYRYSVPKYSYKIEGACLGPGILISNSTSCSNVLALRNDGENLTIIQVET